MDRNAAYFAVRLLQKVDYRLQPNIEENTTTDCNNFNRKEQRREQLNLGYHHASRGDKMPQIEEITKLLDEGIPVDVLYMDFMKAFDSVPHERLLKKIKAHGIGGKLYRA